MLQKRSQCLKAFNKSFMFQVEEQEKLKKRQERFGVSAATVNSVEDKKKLRAERFKL